MKRRSLLLIVLIVLLPVGLLTWFGIRIARDEQMMTQQRFRGVMEQRLQDVNRLVSTQFESNERRLQQITAIDNFDVTAIRQLVRSEPQVTQLFVLSPEGDLLYPNPGDTLNGTELSFLRQASRMFTDRDLQNAVALAEASPGKGDFAPVASAGLAQSSSFGSQSSESFQFGAQTAELPAVAHSTPASAVDASSSPGGLNGPTQLSANAAPETDGVRGSADSPEASAVMTDPAEIMQQRNEFPALPQSADVRIVADNAEPIPQTSGARTDQFKQLQDAISLSKAAVPSFMPSNGWFVWYWDRGLNLVYWQRRPSGHIVGAALERARWIADLIAVLPETDVAASTSTLIATTFRVVSSSAEIVYEWGPDPAEKAVAFSEMPLSSPLASWRIQCFVPDETTGGQGGGRAAFSLAAGLSGFAMTLTALAWLLFRDYSRDMREATQQVSFVNQVSHELKTPLTNIRMYAELLERDLEQVAPEQSEKPRRRLEIITAEAQRLSRLIGNVLTFARQQRKTLQLQPVEVNVAGLVRRIADRFSPSLNDRQITVTLTVGDDRTLWNRFWAI